MTFDEGPPPPTERHPKGWEPHIVEEGDTATGISRPIEGDPSHDDLIRGWGMDPTEWAIVGNVQVRRWQTYDERWLRYYKAELRRRSKARPVDVDDLRRRIARRTYKAPDARPERWGSVVCFNDWQLGKGEGGGSEATVLAVRERLARLDDIWRAEKPPSIDLLLVGDITERTAGNYPAQPFTVDLDEREQQVLALDLLTEAIDIAARRAPVVTLGGVPCNHGETRSGGGKMTTRISDNITLLLLDTMARVVAGRDGLGHVRFAPTPEGAANGATVGDIPIVYTHGHMVPNGTGAMGKALNWWTGQIAGNREPARDAQVLFYAHHHHLQISEEPGRTAFGLPALDGGSQWYTERTGKHSPRGMVAVNIGADIGDPMAGERCWSDLRVL